MIPLKATVNCDMGEGFSLYTFADDEALMKTIHLANIACGFHAGDFTIMNKTVALAKQYHVAVGAHPSLPDRQGFGRREMAMEPDELRSCFIYQIGALTGFLKLHGLLLDYVKPHGAVYGQTARSLPLARAAVGAAQNFSTGNHKVAFMGLAGTAHQVACEEAGVRFIPEWFADLDYDADGKLLITKTHEQVFKDVIETRVQRLLESHEITTNTGGFLPFGDNLTEVSICCHSDTPGAVEIAGLVKAIVDTTNERAGHT
ncbi:lamb YcsF family protein [Mycena alexandri]|uniref:Lamb YcsF family protein n=1 Tax=Mycena alexandri TaxID=1745969 RepID=A0AAD6STQ5_9AGAR|nr:lamb YcsF family protein [Mycena alexandri]